MKEAYDSDLINMQTKRPGLKKLELLPEMEQRLSKYVILLGIYRSLMY